MSWDRYAMSKAREWRKAYGLRWKRRRLLWRALRKRREMSAVRDRTDAIAPGDVLLFAVVRNEIERLPHFLDHYRRIGVDHFLVVDNASNDGTGPFLAAQPDLSLWQTPHSYKQSRFGMDWLTWLMIRYGHGHWCVTVDADEILIYPYHDERSLKDLGRWLEAQGQQSFGAIMIDMYPKGPIGDQSYQPGDDPFEILSLFDAGNYTFTPQPDIANAWIRGGVRARYFFADRPERAPTMGKKPFVKWNRRFVYMNSTHSLLPCRLNPVHDLSGSMTTGILLHSKFLPSVIGRSLEEKERAEHFAVSSLYDSYYEGLAQNPDFRGPESVPFEGWEQLEELGLMARGGWK